MGKNSAVFYGANDTTINIDGNITANNTKFSNVDDSAQFLVSDKGNVNINSGKTLTSGLKTTISGLNKAVVTNNGTLALAGKDGAIGIYYQSDVMKHKRFLNYEYFDPTITRQNIVKEIINFTNQQSIDPLYTWDGVLTSLLRDRFESQKTKRTKAERTKEETEELLDSFSNDFDALTEENGRLRSNISDLEQELACYKNFFNSKEDSDSSFISSGSEEEFFQGEKKAFVLSVLSDSLQNIQDGTRKKDIIQDIIQQNGSENILNHKRDQIKRLLTNYSGLNGKLKQELKQLGFTVTEEGKHYKLTYFDDNRYTITMAKTPSDGRAGKNNVSEINKKVF